MSAARGNALVRSLQEQPWDLWCAAGPRRLVRIEVRRNLFSGRAWWIYFLAFIPTRHHPHPPLGQIAPGVLSR